MATQDLPPPGGFGSISVERTFAKPIVRQSVLLVGSIFMTLYGLNYLAEWRKRYRILRIEQMEHYIATMPFLYAEQERKYLINLYKMREYERELMKGVKGWKVGTYFGEPVYKTLPKNYLPAVSENEFIMGRNEEEWAWKAINPGYNT